MYNLSYEEVSADSYVYPKEVILIYLYVYKIKKNADVKLISGKPGSLQSLSIFGASLSL